MLSGAGFLVPCPGTRGRGSHCRAGDAIYVHDFEGRFIEVNRQSVLGLGYTREELPGLGVVDIDG